MDGVSREKRPEFLVKLGRERLVVRQDERRLADLGDDVGGREGLAGARRPEEGLARSPGTVARHELVDCLRLIARRLERTG